MPTDYTHLHNKGYTPDHATILAKRIHKKPIKHWALNRAMELGGIIKAQSRARVEALIKLGLWV